MLRDQCNDRDRMLLRGPVRRVVETRYPSDGVQSVQTTTFDESGRAEGAAPLKAIGAEASWSRQGASQSRPRVQEDSATLERTLVEPVDALDSWTMEDCRESGSARRAPQPPRRFSTGMVRPR